MLPFSLYFVTGLATGFHIYTLLTLAIYGVPVSPVELISLLGSLTLLIAAYVSLFKPYVAARIALIACLAIWSFYAPALANSVRAKFHKQSSMLQMALQRERQPYATAFLAEPALAERR